MRIGIIAIDSRGGVQPYAALGLGLAAAGHEVQMIVPSDAAPTVSALGLTTTSLSGDMREGARIAAKRGGIGAGRLAPRGVQDLMLAQARTHAAELVDAASDVDVLTGGVGGGMLGRDVAEALGVPFVSTHLHPVGLRTGQLPGVLAPGIPAWLGSPGRRLGQALTSAALTIPFRPFSDAVRRDILRLGRQRRRPDPSLPSLYGFSPRVVPKPTDWPSTAHVTGYWFLDEPDWTPPAELTAFLDAGPAPVSIGFGSMLGADPAHLAETVVDAVRRAGVRAVLLSGWGALADSNSDDILTLPEAPHSWLFPRVLGAIHHGGAGTTGAAVRAGVPSIVVPFAVDQPFWAARLHALGVAPRPLPAKHLTAGDLADALRAIGDVGLRRRATQLGALVRAEAGVASAVAVFNQLT